MERPPDRGEGRWQEDSTRRRRLTIVASITATVLVALAVVVWALGIGRDPVKVDKDVQAQYLDLRLEYAEAAAAWSAASGKARRLQAGLNKGKPRGHVPDTYLEALLAYTDAEAVVTRYLLADIAARRKGSAAEALIDYQAEMIRELTNVRIEGSISDLESGYGLLPRP